HFADLDRAVLEMRAVARDVDRTVVVLSLDFEEPADDLAAFSVWPVDHRSLAARAAHHPARAILKFLAADDHAGLLQTQSPVAIFLNDRLHFGGTRFVESIGF